MTEHIRLPPLPKGWETELLDWVSACQSAYHIDNTPGHRFGGLGSNLEENRSEIVCFVRRMIEDSALAAIKADRQRRVEPVAWRVRPFDYGIGVEGAYAITQLETMRDSWEIKGWNIEPLYLAPQPQQIPEGYALVPTEPTDAMRSAGCRVPLNKAARHNLVYKAMLEAAPEVKP